MVDEVKNIKRYTQENFIEKNSMVDNFRKLVKQEKQNKNRENEKLIKQQEQKEIIDVSKNIINFPTVTTVAIKPVQKRKIRLSDEIIVGARCTILDDWQRHSKTNRLLEYFVFSLPIYTRPGVNYLNNMSEIVAIEKLMGYNPRVYLHGRKNCDTADFFSVTAKMGYHVIKAPEMMSEEHARAIMILIYNKVKRDFAAEDVSIHADGNWIQYPAFFDSRQ